MTSPPIQVSDLQSCDPDPPAAGARPAHHAGGATRTHFTNPWPSFRPLGGPFEAFYARFFRADGRNFVPVPENRAELVTVKTPPDWGWHEERSAAKLKATWIGHASWFVETAKAASPDNNEDAKRGVGILFDPVFSERTSPFKFIGPKRYTPTPCTISELPPVDIVAISHNHYDHLDIDSIKELWRVSQRIHFFCGLGNKAWFESLDCKIPPDQIHEMDWWEGADVDVPGVGKVRLTCTPAQHFSARSITDRNVTLWCSWVVEEVGASEGDRPHKLFFAGDTGYRKVDSPNPTAEEEAKAPVCPAFKQIGKQFGPFDLALVPIGLYSPRDHSSSIHAAPEDSVCIHRDVRSKKSIGMHYGTVRGALSAQFEDVREPPRRWREMCEKAGLKWGEEVGLCGVGDTVMV